MKYLSVAFFFLLVTVSCRKRDQTAVPWLTAAIDTAGPAVILDSFPFKVGNSWTYKVQSQSGPLASPEPVSSSTYTLTVLADTVIKGFHIFTLAKTISPSNVQFEYFLKANNDIYSLESINAMDSFVKLDSTKLLVNFPSKIGYRWSYSYRIDMGYTGTWDSYVKIETGAGLFNCVKFIYGIYWREPTEKYDRYYSSKGLVREVYNFSGGGPIGPGEGPSYIISITTLESTNF